MRNIIVLPDGTRISSGSAAQHAIQSCTVTECVNSDTELTLGSTCCACLEVTIITKDETLGLSAGQAITLYKADDSGTETKVGTFRLETPTKQSDNFYKVTAYDNVSKLDKDLSTWLKGLAGWPYTLITFAGMICSACGLTLATTSIPNGSFPVPQFYKSGVTGRQLMQWIGEIAARFCRADAAGNIELAWYTSSGVTIRPTGDRYYFAGALTNEDYEVAAIDAVKLRLADSDDGALWPSGDADNPYIITGNPILLASVTTALEPYLTVIQQQLAALPTYKPCKISLPAGLDIRAGHTVQIVDKKGNTFTTCVMTKTQSGQRDTMECTGSARRGSSTAANNKTAAQIAAEQESYAQSAARQAVDAQTWQEIFDKWTDNGNIQGIFAQDGIWIFNAAVAKITNLVADLITAGRLKSADGKTYFDLDPGEIVSTDAQGNIITISGGAIKLANSSGVTQLLVQRSDGQTMVMLSDATGQMAGGIGAIGNKLLVFTQDEASGGTVVGRPVKWKTVNGETILVAYSLEEVTSESNE